MKDPVPEGGNQDLDPVPGFDGHDSLADEFIAVDHALGPAAQVQEYIVFADGDHLAFGDFAYFDMGRRVNGRLEHVGKAFFAIFCG